MCEQAGDAPGFFVLQGVVTPDAAMVAAGLLGLPNRPRSLRELAEVVTPHVEAFCCAHGGRAPCIVMVDFVSATTIVPSMLSVYYKSLSLPRSHTQQPAIRTAWRLPADKSLLESRGASWGTFWDPEKNMPRSASASGPRTGEDEAAKAAQTNGDRAAGMPVEAQPPSLAPASGDPAALLAQQQMAAQAQLEAAQAQQAQAQAALEEAQAAQLLAQQQMAKLQQAPAPQPASA